MSTFILQFCVVDFPVLKTKYKLGMYNKKPDTLPLLAFKKLLFSDVLKHLSYT